MKLRTSHQLQLKYQKTEIREKKLVIKIFPSPRIRVHVLQFFLPVVNCTQDYVNREIWKQQILYTSLKYVHIEYLTEFHGSQGGDCQFHNLNTIFHIKAKKYIKDGMFSLCPVKQPAQPHPLFFLTRYSDASQLL